MESYATKAATIEFLTSIGFKPVDEEFYDSPKNDADYGMPVIQLYVYQCNNGYYCVDADGGFRAPVVWDGPVAAWDKSNTGDEFIEWLNTNCPGWR